MKKLISIGEALIDFIPTESGKKIKQVDGFKPAVGGAPANVCAAFTKLGGESKMITQLGEDPFGDKIIDEFVERIIVHKDYFEWKLNFMNETIKLEISGKSKKDGFLIEHSN